MSHQIILPRVMHIGKGASERVADTVKGLNCRNPLLVTDKVMVELGYSAAIVNILETAGITVDVFSDTVPEPTVASISRGVDAFNTQPYDCIIALGGGSPIDSAKAIAILGKHGGQMKDYKFPRVVDEAGIPIIAIPTTAGTGSEVTRFTIITDEDTTEKMLCVGLGFMPIAALVDYTLTQSLPARVTADTGIDALTHAIEAFVSRKANLYSDAQALSAMALIAPNLRTVFADPSNDAAKESMMLGATLAGIAFSNASVALVHGMSRPIGAAFHVPHGLSNAMLLPAVTAFSIPSAPVRYAQCARAMGIATQGDSDDMANQKLINELKMLNADLQVPTPADFGIDKEAFFALASTMAEQALASGSPNNNPRVPTIEEMVAIYVSLWE
ncbi:iron-containing alcohol dehydrogenase [Alteromonas mediterranea MED64]|uniref:Alcohol dehydrogenase n=1 Tax=Alteromonas mediterranea (strain DSM 17117 / CIP 110805 / LMG 28347 / Deep ecotype) TaxID=1774373 RepID=F2G6K4_ALTMD|nr:iron-containing alcohol dehydrogenase [Alteromonas mediterranea]AEA97541.1 alcohol dehydrogenase [Alteromonas mediterranea DE]AGP81376.1 iron-containing alcohol dehydrogenase [Alteromonas mediterranea MED64]MBR9895692.1 iron-containing alcohol dehydrogenase [Gammaproteobacteria bacterium]CAH1214834.1 Lactaldehyde reductase [Alteromonas mediterranea]|tara:strand:- start:7258 stop:8418 length:1161 start_codon:yes stop_codon:yes gene_type:complete